MKTPDIRGPVTESSADRDESLFNSQTLIPGTIWPRRWCEKLLEQECVIPFKDHWNRSWLYLSNCKLQTASSCWVLTIFVCYIHPPIFLMWLKNFLQVYGHGNGKYCMGALKDHSLVEEKNFLQWSGSFRLPSLEGISPINSALFWVGNVVICGDYCCFIFWFSNFKTVGVDEFSNHRWKR